MTRPTAPNGDPLPRKHVAHLLATVTWAGATIADEGGRLVVRGDRAQSEDLRVGQIAIGLKDIAKRLKIPVVALSQLNRSVEDRANKMPGLADLRYSGQIEQVADVVAFIMRPEYYAERGMKIEVENRDDLKGVAYLSIAKNRHGPVANVKLAFVKQLSKFAELAQVQP